MNEYDEHLDRYLSGETSLENLPAELSSEERRLRELLESVREKPEVSPTLYEGVMEAVASMPTPAPAWRRALDWLTRPRTFQVSPATAGLALAAIVVALLLVPGVGPWNGTEPIASSDGVVTRFVFIAPEASSVQITGDFVDWNRDGIALAEERATGIWTVDVPLEPGVYQYAFIVDGVDWRPDPRAVSNVDDGFGRENSVVIVSGENAT